MAQEHENWRSIAAQLGIQVVSPVVLTLNGTCVEFTALLSHFGGVAGMIVDPASPVLKPYATALREQGYGYSCIGIAGCAPASMRDVLREWSWTGPDAEKPDWL